MTNHIRQLLAKFHQNLMKHFQIMPKKPHFWHLSPIIPGLRFFKKQKRHFLHIIKLQLSAENQNNPMSRFRDLYRTDGRTNGRRLNHKSQPLHGGPKTKTSLSSHNQVTTFCQKSESSYELILRYAPNVRMNERRLNHKSQPLRGGPKIISRNLAKKMVRQMLITINPYTSHPVKTALSVEFFLHDPQLEPSWTVQLDVQIVRATAPKQVSRPWR